MSELSGKSFIIAAPPTDSEQWAQMKRDVASEWVRLLQEFVASSYTRFAVAPKELTIPRQLWWDIASDLEAKGALKDDPQLLKTIEVATAYGMVRLTRSDS